MPVHAIPKAETLDGESPTKQIVRESNPIRTVVDVQGRTIRYKNLTILERARLARALGELSSNLSYFGMVATAACVIDIDGDSGFPKTKPSFLEQRLEWLGDDGWDALIADDRLRSELEDGDEQDRTTQAKNS